MHFKICHVSIYRPNTTPGKIGDPSTHHEQYLILLQEQLPEVWPGNKPSRARKYTHATPCSFNFTSKYTLMRHDPCLRGGKQTAWIKGVLCNQSYFDPCICFHIVFAQGICHKASAQDSHAAESSNSPLCPALAAAPTGTQPTWTAGGQDLPVWPS